MSISTYDQEKSNLLNNISSKKQFMSYLDKLTVSKILQIIYNKYGEVILNKTNKPYFTVIHNESTGVYSINDNRESTRASLIKSKYIDVLYDLTIGSKNVNYTTRRSFEERDAVAADELNKKGSLTSAEQSLLKQLTPDERLHMLTRFRRDGVLESDLDAALKQLGVAEITNIASYLDPVDCKNLLAASTNQIVRKTLNVGIEDASNVELVNRPILDKLQSEPLYTLEQFKTVLLELIANMQLNETKEIYIIYTDSCNTIRNGEGIPVNELPNVIVDINTVNNTNVYKIDRSTKFNRIENNRSIGVIRSFTIKFGAIKECYYYGINRRNYITIIPFIGSGNKQIKESSKIIGVKSDVVHIDRDQKYLLTQLTKLTNMCK